MPTNHTVVAGVEQIRKNLASTATPTHSVVPVGATTTAVLPANTDRKYTLLCNDSDSTMYLKIGAVAVASQGIRLNSGTSYEISAVNGNLFTGAINAISAGANKSLLVTEAE